MKNKCNTLTRKTKKIYIEYIDKNENLTLSKTFWNTVTPFTTNKGTISDENIKIKAVENQNIEIKNKNKNKLISIETNDCLRTKVSLLKYSSVPENDEETEIKNHPSVSKIKYNQNETLNFDFPTAKVEDINKIIKSLNPRKVTDPDGIPVKPVKIYKF